jgi:Uma2 family endonuclease
MSDAAIPLPPDQRLSREAYRQWALTQSRGRFERIDGVVVAMAPERRSHAKRKARAWQALDRAIEAAGLPCQAYPDGMTIEVEDSDYEPDAVLRCGEPLPDDGIDIPDPVIVVEVLSPSTRDNDLTRKLADYFKLPTLHHYLIIFPDQQQVIHHRRAEGANAIATRLVTSGEIKLDPPGLTITVEELYKS